MKKRFYDTHAYENGEDEEEDFGPSKSELKRQAEALQTLGKELTQLAPDQLKRVPLPEDVSLAIEDYKRMKSFGAQRRQLQLIGKLMRALGGAAVREAIDRATGDSRAAVAAHQKAEKARDALIASDEALTAWVQSHPETDVQKLRQLVRSARKERDSNKPPKSAREIYRLIYRLELPDLDLMAKDDEQE